MSEIVRVNTLQEKNVLEGEVNENKNENEWIILKSR